MDDNRIALEGALKQAIEIGRGRLAMMGQRGRELILRKYNWDAVARQMHELYLGAIKEKEMASSSGRTC